MSPANWYELPEPSGVPPTEYSPAGWRALLLCLVVVGGGWAALIAAIWVTWKLYG